MLTFLPLLLVLIAARSRPLYDVPPSVRCQRPQGRGGNTLNKGCLPETELHNEEISKYRQRPGKHTSTHMYWATKDDGEGFFFLKKILHIRHSR